MLSAAAFGSLTLTLALVISRPKVGNIGRLNPMFGAIPGVVIMLALGVLTPPDVLRAVHALWKPLVTVGSIMVTTSVAHQLGIFDRITRSIEIRTRGAVPRAFTTVYVIGALTAAVFNNDAAILLLTPIVVPVIRRLYPRRPYLVVPFAFAVFASAGVAPLSTSNPMNLVVAEHSGIGFNAYAARMIPVALVGSIVSYLMMRIVFRHQLEDSIPARGAEEGSLAPMDPGPVGVLGVVVAMFASYPVLSYFDLPVWIAAAGGAVLTSAIGLRERKIVRAAILHGVAWDVLAFLFFIFLTAYGLQNAGITRTMARVYAAAGGTQPGEIALVGGVSSLLSAILNNHPTAALNALVVGTLPGDPRWRTFAALVGGDLGPRLLPMGSLAGLLWMDMARRHGAEIGTRDFVRVGVKVTIPALVASLAVLWIEVLVVR